MLWALHGNLGSLEDWGVLLNRGVNCLPVDLWSTVTPFDAWAKDFCADVARQDPEPVLLGYSLGGRLALHALLAEPGMWNGAVIVSTHPGLGSAREREERVARDALWAGRIRKEDLRAVLADWDLQDVFRKGASPPKRDMDFLTDRREALARGFEVWSLGRQADLLPRLGEIGCPARWLTGDGDEEFRALGGQAVARLRVADHVVVPDCAHRVPWEQPERFAESVREFLRELR